MTTHHTVQLHAPLLRGLLLLGTLMLGGCNPFDQPGTWHATGASQANLDTEAIDKADTVAGHGTPGSDGILDAAAVLRLHTDKIKPLKTESTSAGISSQ